MPTMKGRHTIRRHAGQVTGNPLEPRRPRGRGIEPWSFDEPRPNSTLARLEKAYLSVLAGVDGVEDHKAAVLKSGKYTPDGAQAETLLYAVSKVAPELRRAKQHVEAARHEVAQRRAKLTLPIDRTDAYGLARRAEFRSWLRSLPQEERHAIGANFEKLDPELALAITEMPAPLSGVLETDRQQLLDRALQARHGKELAELRTLEAAIPIVETVVEAGREEIAHEAGVFDLAKFDELAKPYVEKVNAPWLRKFTENGVEVVKTFTPDPSGRSATFQPATEEQIEAGVYFASAEEWRRARGEPPSTTEQFNVA